MTTSEGVTEMMIKECTRDTNSMLSISHRTAIQESGVEETLYDAKNQLSQLYKTSVHGEESSFDMEDLRANIEQHADPPRADNALLPSQVAKACRDDDILRSPTGRANQPPTDFANAD